MENLMLPNVSPKIAGIDANMIPFSLFHGNWNFYYCFWVGVLEHKNDFCKIFPGHDVLSEKSLQFPEVVIDSSSNFIKWISSGLEVLTQFFVWSYTIE